MVRDAESHADEDQKRKAEAEVRNNADNLVYQTDKLLADQGDQLTEDETTNVTEKLEDLKKALGGDDVEAIGSATEALMVTSQEFGQRLYEAAQAESDAAGASGSTDGSDDDVVDAEIVDES
jgi:molecular chaperone DnaK